MSFGTLGLTSVGPFFDIIYKVVSYRRNNMSVRIGYKEQPGKDTPLENRTVYDSDGFKWHFGPNETKSFLGDGPHLTMASNATVVFGTANAQAQSPDVVADAIPFGSALS